MKVFRPQPKPLSSFLLDFRTFRAETWQVEAAVSMSSIGVEDLADRTRWNVSFRFCHGLVGGISWGARFGDRFWSYSITSLSQNHLQIRQTSLVLEFQFESGNTTISWSQHVRTGGGSDSLNVFILSGTLQHYRSFLRLPCRHIMVGIEYNCMKPTLRFLAIPFAHINICL